MAARFHRRAGVAVGAIALVACAACGPRPGALTPPPVLAPIAIVLSEQSTTGARLVSISANGDREFEVVQPALTTVRDVNPTISPDGKWIAFVSSRGRALDETSLWIAPLAMTATPHLLTDGTAIDSQPTWTADGRALVFASTRSADHRYHLWRMDLDFAGAAPTKRELTQLTNEPGYEVTPAVAADGTIYYAEVVAAASGAATSVLEVRAPDGATRPLTAGPADTSPALSPDGKTIVFARVGAHGKLVDSDLWRMPASGGANDAAPLIEVALTDESGPVWTRDGRYVLATSLLRGDGGRVLFSSVIVVDTRETPAVARILEESAGPTWRLTPAVSGVALDDSALHADASYLAELKRIIAEAIQPAGTP